MKKWLIFFSIITASFADPSDNLIAYRGDDGEIKCAFVPTISGGGCCSGNPSTNCNTNILDSFNVMTNRVNNNFQRLNARWLEIGKAYNDILLKSTYMTKNVLEEEASSADELAYIYKNTFEMEKYNKLLENEAELERLSSSILLMEQEMMLIRENNKEAFNGK
ncbi:hypothetical protein [Campylobacter sp. JMF_03 NE3]|uniref:hypothetical protein n=1 Tax=Campylobacter sp. JMF_03 NE3 TaxID=2983831 RepID=UPI0022E9A341|nr:hypothetical protein [Campylobacter sp. JMF_03 NE3]MDA3053516.1 hypothetical protein [Campylobacter sp. JMF_03 NE3]